MFTYVFFFGECGKFGIGFIVVLGEEGRRRMENRTKSNDQLFSEYFDVITNTRAVRKIRCGERKTQALTIIYFLFAFFGL